MARQKVDHRHPRVAVGSCDRRLQPCTQGRMSIQNTCIKFAPVVGVPAKSQILWGLVWSVEEARFGPGVARGTGRLDAQEDGVRVAIDPRLHHLHRVPGCGPLLPQAARPRLEPGLSGLAGLRPRLLVHVGQHQHLARLRVLDHSRDEPLGEVGRHRLTSSPRFASSSFTAEIDTSPKWKIVAASEASAPPAVIASYMWAALPAPPEAITGSFTAVVTALNNATS